MGVSSPYMMFLNYEAQMMKGKRKGKRKEQRRRVGKKNKIWQGREKEYTVKVFIYLRCLQ